MQLVAQPEHLAHADDTSPHPVACAEYGDCSTARGSRSHRAVSCVQINGVRSVGRRPRGAHALDLCRSSWWLQRLWVKRLCCGCARLRAIRLMPKPGGYARKRFVRFQLSRTILTERASRAEKRTLDSDIEKASREQKREVDETGCKWTAMDRVRAAAQ